MFTAVKFQNFKSLRDFTIHLKGMNVLVGPNNAGKSTVLDAFRVMMAAYRYASRRVPSPLQVKDQAIVGYDIPTAQIPISLANTHSAEMVNEAEHDDVIIINKAQRAATRVYDIDGLQEALFSIGSGQNIHLARLSRGKRILFLEGDDYRLLRRFAARLDLGDLAESTEITAVPIGGFGQRQKIENAAWTFEKVLRSEISIAAILDRDYRCAEEIDEIVRDARTTVAHFHILQKKELENYLLAPAAVARAISERLADRRRTDIQISVDGVKEMFDAISTEMKSTILSQAISNRMRYFANRTARDPASIANEAITKLDEEWSDLDRRMGVVPGKQFLATLNTRLQRDFGVTITAPQIIRHLAPANIAPDLCRILSDINQFAR
jgi:predicted ATP-dependent endonuclease of OLD family